LVPLGGTFQYNPSRSRGGNRFASSLVTIKGHNDPHRLYRCFRNVRDF